MGVTASMGAGAPGLFQHSLSSRLGRAAGTFWMRWLPCTFRSTCARSPALFDATSRTPSLGESRAGATASAPEVRFCELMCELFTASRGGSALCCCLCPDSALRRAEWTTLGLALPLHLGDTHSRCDRPFRADMRSLQDTAYRLQLFDTSQSCDGYSTGRAGTRDARWSTRTRQRHGHG